MTVGARSGPLYELRRLLVLDMRRRGWVWRKAYREEMAAITMEALHTGSAWSLYSEKGGLRRVEKDDVLDLKEPDT